MPEGLPKALPKALIVDSEPLSALLICDELEQLGVSCQSVSDGKAAMSLLASDRSWSLLVAEARPTGGGLGAREIGRFARSLIADIRVVHLSDSSIPAAGLARNEHVLRMPYETDELRALLQELRLAERDAAPPRLRRDELVGQHPTGWRVDLATRQATRGDLVLGYEVGTGGQLKVTILAGGGDEETNCMLAGEAMEAIGARMRNAS